MIEITCVQEGLRRGGVIHPKGVTTYPDATFTGAQLGAMAAERKLIVVALEPDGSDQGGVDKEAEEAAYRFHALLLACAFLDSNKENKRDWTRTGMPQTAALELKSGHVGVTAAERDEVYTFYLEGLKS